MNNFSQLIYDCGLSLRGAARLLDVRYDTVRNWQYNKCGVPDGVMNDLEKYALAGKSIFSTTLP